MNDGAAVDSRWLSAVDELAGRLIERAEPIRFTEAVDADEVDAAHRLRRQVVIDEGWLSAESVPEVLEDDEYDNRAIQVIAWDGATAAGTVSLVLPAEGRLLPVEASFGLTVEPVGQVVGAGRLIVARPYRDKNHRVLGGLAAMTWRVMRRHGFRWTAGTATAGMLDLFRQLGFDIVVLGEPQTYWGELRFPIRMGAPDPYKWSDPSAIGGRG